LQVGAELFGHAGVESDVEIISLLLDSLQLLSIDALHIDLGHVGIFRGLARDAALSAQQENELFEALQRKAVPEIEELLKACVADAGARRRLAALAELNGDSTVLQRARKELAGASAPVQAALDNLAAIAALIEQRAGAEIVNFDLAELRGYRYQTGMVFAVFVPGRGQEIARGGRYDAIGSVFGRSRPATGFSTDLRELMQLSRRAFAHRSGAVFAPAGEDAELLFAIAALRDSGERVVRALPGQQGGALEMQCDRVLVDENGQWVVKPV
jgi:ATP phosphoribosyltransferase regulatory subunit